MNNIEDYCPVDKEVYKSIEIAESTSKKLKPI